MQGKALKKNLNKECKHDVSVIDLQTLCEKYQTEGNHQLLEIVKPLIVRLTNATLTLDAGEALHKAKV